MMVKTIRNVAIAVIVVMAVIAAYRLIFIRTVYYDIGGIKIPSTYNFLTGSVKPLLNYDGKPIKQTVQDRRMKKVGLAEGQVTLAQFRWAIFEQWVRMHPEYKNWDKDSEIFKKANTAFRKEMEIKK